MRIARRLLPLLIVAAAGAGFVALRMTGPSAPTPVTSERIWPVRGMPVEPGVYRPSAELFGRVQSPQTATLRAAIEGIVAHVPVREGDIVKPADVLLRIDPSEARLTLTQREAELREAQAMISSEQLRAESDERTLNRERQLLQISQRGLDRAQDLHTRNLGSDASVDEAQRLLEQARLAVIAREQAVADAPARLEQAEARKERTRAARDRAALDLSRTEITASVAARVVELHTSMGERVRIGDPLVRLYATDDVEIRASLPDAMIATITGLLERHGPLPARARVDGAQIRAQLVRIAGETRPGEAGIGAVFRVTEGGAALPLNRFVNLRLELPAQPDSVPVPFEALYGRDRVYRVVDERMQGLRVERLGEQVGEDGRTLALIRHPELRAGDVLVVTRLPNAVDGLPVEVTLDIEGAGE
ncbi:efflux transporter, RND family, MFP subunit [Thioalkalivibrio nitratireducens DSM 14787]|uniref:Efflux transporter, RND family, MFP subunit n=1 Tax=Thioalkalivibrio nitratireducens (strain DSM 14787 / UNIQEM 213 / ALEN2) TaxID=1255043 RepID=L0DW25_THIND|nr:efflux transporter, RND family, MFP subunit [Thioalkalivibrio nitratireducens DSM 14787]